MVVATIRVREAIRAYNTMKFDYEESGDGYLVTLSYTEQETTQEIKVSTKERVCQLIIDNNQMTIVELAKVIGVSENAIKQQLAKLKKEGVIKRVGSTKAGHWEVIK